MLFQKSASMFCNPWKIGEVHSSSCKISSGINLSCPQTLGLLCSFLFCFLLDSCHGALAGLSSFFFFFPLKFGFSRLYSGRCFHRGFAHGIKSDKRVRISLLIWNNFFSIIITVHVYKFLLNKWFSEQVEHESQ